VAVSISTSADLSRPTFDKAQALCWRGSTRWTERKSQPPMVRSVRQRPSGSSSSSAASAPSSGATWRSRAATRWSSPTTQYSTLPSLRATSRTVRVAASASSG
jgi:hypothetical protein